MTLAGRLRAAVDAPVEALRGDWDFEPGGTAAPETLTPAAVLIAVITRARPTVLFTRRHAGLRQHAGQVAFPGGRIDPEDDGPVAAALREAHEEVALPPRKVAVVGVTDGYSTGTGYHITPVIGLIAPDLPLVPAIDEVDSLFEVPLDHLLDPANHQLRRTEWQGRMRAYYVIAWETHEIWGATAGMVVNLARRMRSVEVA